MTLQESLIFLVANTIIECRARGSIAIPSAWGTKLLSKVFNDNEGNVDNWLRSTLPLSLPLKERVNARKHRDVDIMKRARATRLALLRRVINYAIFCRTVKRYTPDCTTLRYISRRPSTGLSIVSINGLARTRAPWMPREERVVAFDLFGTGVEPRGLPREDPPKLLATEGPLFTVGSATGIIRPPFFSLYAG